MNFPVAEATPFIHRQKLTIETLPLESIPTFSGIHSAWNLPSEPSFSPRVKHSRTGWKNFKANISNTSHSHIELFQLVLVSIKKLYSLSLS